MKLTYIGQLRGGKNNMKMDPRSGRHYPSKEWQSWRDDAVWQFQSQWTKQFFKGACSFNVKYWPGDRRRRDVTALTDALFHVLEYLGVVLDDSQFKCVYWEDMGLDREHPRAEIVIEEMLKE